MNKKAMSLLVGIIIGLILLLVVSAVYYTFFQKVSVSTKGAVVDSACRASLDLTAAKIKGPFKTTLLNLGIQPKCEIYDVIITQKDINLVSAATKENDENAIKRIIAEIMTQGIVVTTKDAKGNLARRAVGGLFATASRGQKRFFEDSAGRFCMPWATINFDKDVREKTPQVKGFRGYLFETPITAKSLTSYAGYISNVQGDLVPTGALVPVNIKDEGGDVINSDKSKGIISGENGLKAANIVDFFSTSEDYGLFYVQDVKSNWALIGAAIGIGVGVILIPFTAGASAIWVGAGVATILSSTMVLFPAAIGSGIAGYAIGDYVEGEGYSYWVFLIGYNRKAVEGLGCDYLK